jgi:hypothetical protein
MHEVVERKRLRTQQFEISLSTFKLVEADLCLDRDTSTRVPYIRIIARYDREPFTFGFPREIDDVVYRKCVNVRVFKDIEGQNAAA